MFIRIWCAPSYIFLKFHALYLEWLYTLPVVFTFVQKKKLKTKINAFASRRSGFIHKFNSIRRFLFFKFIFSLIKWQEYGTALSALLISVLSLSEDSFRDKVFFPKTHYTILLYIRFYIYNKIIIKIYFFTLLLIQAKYIEFSIIVIIIIYIFNPDLGFCCCCYFKFRNI